MKTILMFILIVGNLFAITPEDAAWLLNAQTNLTKAYEKAKAEKKKMLLLIVVKDGCQWCKMMVYETLKDKNIQENLSDIEMVIVDIDSVLPKEFQAKLTPTMFFIDVKSKKTILKDVGYIKKGTFLIDIISAIDLLE